jgi:hypothetical protein
LSSRIGGFNSGWFLWDTAGKEAWRDETKRSALERLLTALRKELSPDAAIWVSWPKKSSKVAADITENTIRDVALPLGFVDIKVCIH